MIDIKSTKEDDHIVIEVTGEVDASSSINLDTAINKAIEDGETKLLIDCHRLNYISSAGLGVFMSHIQDLENNKLKMVIYGLNEKVINVFQILGLDELLKIVDEKNQALELL